MNKKYKGLAGKIKGYQKSLQKYGLGPRALQWRSKKAAELRYQQLIADIDFEGKNVLDVGCGFGDIIAYIKHKTKDFSYIGIDIVPEFVKIAQKRHPDHKFLVGDYQKLVRGSDIILCSGVLNSKTKRPYQDRKKAIETFFSHAKEVLVFNMAGGHPQPENKKINRVYFVDSLKILEYCFSLTNKLIFRHHYRKKDFTIVMFK